MSSASQRVMHYHQRTKHQLQRYAAGPDTLDWDAQPQAFRDWIGSPVFRLPLQADQLETTWAQLARAAACPVRALDISAIACLMELSFGLTAWKQFGPDRWALRANPSSGNLHPTEVYLLVTGVHALRDGLYHYAPREHALVLRATCTDGARAGGDEPQLWIGLSAIQWREAWKYGERAFRYCQLDAGHALGALRYAAAALGWQARTCLGARHEDLAQLMGLDRDADFGSAEREEPELLIRVGPDINRVCEQPRPVYEAWFGQASRLDAHPMYRWPVIAEVSQASRRETASDQPPLAPGEKSSARPVAHDWPAQARRGHERAAEIIRGRRSAQQFDRRASMPLPVFWRAMQALMPERLMPWDAWPEPAGVHVLVFAHRVEGLMPGVYALPRSPQGEVMLRTELKAAPAWQPVDAVPHGLPLWRLADNPSLAGTCRTLSCHQAIGGDACFAVSLIADFAAPVARDASSYRRMLQEAGLIGQVLYLQAEADGFRGTGIGCYFDDAVHALLGVDGSAVQVLYHFTVGEPLMDQRISTEPPYAHLHPSLSEGPALVNEGASP